MKVGSAIYLSKPRKYTYKNISVWVMPTVFPPFITISTKILLEFIETLPLKDRSFLELGCGCGIISIVATKNGANVTATDINLTALPALAKNATENEVTITILESDLFENLQKQHFDYIIINPPYYPKKPTSIAESAWFCGENFDYFEALFLQLPTYTSEKNEIYMILSEDCDITMIQSIAAKNDLTLQCIVEKSVLKERNYIFKIEMSANRSV